jgi:hypothetical protein
MILGIGCGAEREMGTAYYGLFVEGGKSEFKSVTPDPRRLSAKGDLEFFGGGAMGRFDFNHIKPGHFYIEGAVQYGRIDTKYKSEDVTTLSGIPLAYNNRSDYVGALVGGGFVFYLNEKSTLDLSTKHFYSQIRGSESKSNFDQDISFSPANSHRTLVSLNFSHAVRRYFSFHLGTGVEYESDGERAVTVSGRRLEATTFKGFSYIFDGGIKFSPSMGSPLSISLGIQGSLGRRKGLSGTFNFSYAF